MAYYVKGVGTFETEPLVTTDENGNRVVQSSGLVRQGELGSDGKITGGKLASAYDYARNGTKQLFERWHSSRNANSEDFNRILDGLFNEYRARGEYTGGREDFLEWLKQYRNDMFANTLSWGRAFSGNPTKKANGELITDNMTAKKRSYYS